jgi:hypothetical protein
MIFASLLTVSAESLENGKEKMLGFAAIHGTFRELTPY